MIRTYVFKVYFIDVEDCYTLSFKIASSSFKSAFSKLQARVVGEFATRCVSANVNPVYELECNGSFIARSIPARYPSTLFN